MTNIYQCYVNCEKMGPENVRFSKSSWQTRAAWKKTGLTGLIIGPDQNNGLYVRYHVSWVEHQGFSTWTTVKMH